MLTIVAAATSSYAQDYYGRSPSEWCDLAQKLHDDAKETGQIYGFKTIDEWWGPPTYIINIRWWTASHPNGVAHEAELRIQGDNEFYNPVLRIRCRGLGQDAFNLPPWSKEEFLGFTDVADWFR